MLRINVNTLQITKNAKQKLKRHDDTHSGIDKFHKKFWY